LARERQARDLAEAAARAKDEFLAVVSHELRTPLNAMLGWTRLLRSQQPGDATLAHGLEIIERSAAAQNKLVEDLLDVSRVIRGQLRLDIRPLELAPLIKAACEGLRPAAEAKRIKLRVQLEAAGGTITGDPDRLQQVIWNLLSNAIKFTPRGGRITLRLDGGEAQARVRISDNGCGISPEFLPYVFDCFRQADSSSSRRQGGLGLGLALVRYVVELHGGTVAVESPGEGQGATFTVTLPCQAVTAPRAGREPDPAGSEKLLKFSSTLEGLWVVVVDDEEGARELVTAMLKQYGARVTAVASSAEAFAVFAAAGSGPYPDLLVSDICMPGEDGYALIQRVRALPPERGGQLPAVALTAHGRVEDRLRALAAGFQMHVPKPIEPAELATVIASLAGRFEKGASA